MLGLAITRGYRVAHDTAICCLGTFATLPIKISCQHISNDSYAYDKHDNLPNVAPNYQLLSPSFILG